MDHKNSLTALKIEEITEGNSNEYIKKDLNSDNSMLSPSGKEAIEILDELYNALDFDSIQGTKNLRRGDSEEGSISNHSLPEMHDHYTNNSEVNLHSKELVEEFKKEILEEKRTENKKSNASEKSIHCEPVRLRINMDEEESVFFLNLIL